MCSYSAYTLSSESSSYSLSELGLADDEDDALCAFFAVMPSDARPTADPTPLKIFLRAKRNICWIALLSLDSIQVQRLETLYIPFKPKL